ncbi:MAG TPA: Fic family protein, partial [Microthrixaceae bacterium]|nr:Fic family protein [Microthrixaceae bacterium]
FARNVQGSNSIEGYDASLDDVLAAVDDEETLEAGEETRLALRGYRDALTYVMQIARDADPPPIDESLLKSLQFMMIRHDLSKNPGQWRPGAIWVEREDDHELVYEAPDRELVPELIGELVASLNQSSDPADHAVIRAAMAHLNLVMIHPYSDGNGRMARCLQTLVLAREQILAPEFSSIEEYLGRNTTAYYDVLATVGQGAWNPGNDALPWVRFCLTAHHRQAQTLLRRVEETEQLWAGLEDLVRERGVPSRSIGPLADAARGLRLGNATYRRLVAQSEGEDIAELTATRDLKRLVDADLLAAVGERRGRSYTPSKDLRMMWAQIRANRPKRSDEDPFVDVQEL